MQKMVSFFKRFGLLPIVLIVSVFVVGIASYLTGTLGTSQRGTAITQLNITANPTLQGTPAARFEGVDIAIINAINNEQYGHGSMPMGIIGPKLQPVGAYMPRSGNTVFNILDPTPLPTPLPYATSPPLPLPPVPQQILPTVASPDTEGEEQTPRVLPAGGSVCAPSGLPADGILTQRFHVYHSGIDIGIPLNTPIVATHSGQVTFAGWSEIGYGYLVIIQSDRFITYYAHNTSFNVEVNQMVGKGSIVAWSGSTGNSTGPHLHYETRIDDIPVDPLTFEDRGFSTC